MNTVELQTLERRKITQLAHKYADMGYEVFATLPQYRSPQEIEGFVPDLVVRKGDETIIIEVKTSESLRNSKKVVRLAEYGSRHPNVRFDLVVTNPRPESSSKRRIQVLERERNALYGRMLSDMDEAIDNELYDVAIVLASQILEGLLTRVAERKEVEVPRSASLATLAQSLFNGQVISESVVEFAAQVQDVRNGVIHPDSDSTGNLLANLTKDYLEDVRQKLALLVRDWS
jgi:hypothetical protein